ncbi:hypothetical protein [Nocardia acidivorans]|uniref:hypothetical protein n=1 Tax=Nocardia acidivorans TaxID=404580 RepID=UPI00082DF5CB|nr:hypothetical protein [Nocardia acidivorans]
MTDIIDNPLEVQDPETAEPAAPSARTVSLRLSTVLRGAIAVGLIAPATTFGLLWWSAERDLDHNAATAADTARAEQVAAEYALGASTVDYQNLPAWLAKLKNGTAAQLATKFDATGPALQQLLTPLRWTSTATAIAAKVRSESGGIYQVDVFLDVNSTSAQTPDGARTTVTYHVTVDRGSDWKITDVGGLDGALPTR